MIRDTFSILFYLKTGKENRNGETAIYCRITIRGKRAEFSTKRYVLKNQWDSTKGRIKGKTEVSKSINSYLEAITNKLHHTQGSLLEKGYEVSAYELKNAFLGNSDNSKTLIQAFEFHNNRMLELVGIEYAEGTYERFTTAMSHVKEFMMRYYNIQDILLNKMKYQFITDFEFYLRKDRNCGNNTSIKYIQNIRKIINVSIKNGWLDKDPFTSFDGKTKIKPKPYLTEEELKVLEEKEFPIKRLEEIRDIFIFQCYTGYAYAEVANLTPEKIVVGIDGSKWIYHQRQKTDVTQNVPILPKAQEILDKYNSHPLCLVHNTLLPVKSNQKMNAYLKEVADICGIDKNLTTHLARHTFATTVTLSHGVPLETVSKLLGHSSIKMTQHYAKVVEKKVSEDMLVLKHKLKSS